MLLVSLILWVSLVPIIFRFFFLDILAGQIPDDCLLTTRLDRESLGSTLEIGESAARATARIVEQEFDTDEQTPGLSEEVVRNLMFGVSSDKWSCIIDFYVL